MPGCAAAAVAATVEEHHDSWCCSTMLCTIRNSIDHYCAGTNRKPETRRTSEVAGGWVCLEWRGGMHSGSSSCCCCWCLTHPLSKWMLNIARWGANKRLIVHHSVSHLPYPFVPCLPPHHTYMLHAVLLLRPFNDIQGPVRPENTTCQNPQGPHHHHGICSRCPCRIHQHHGALVGKHQGPSPCPP